MVEHLTEDQIQSFKDAFSLFDKDNSGTVTTKELGTVMWSMDMEPSDEELEEMIREVDTDGSGELDFKEFLMLMAKRMNDQASKEAEQIMLNKAFDHFIRLNKDGRDKLSCSDVLQGAKDLGETMTEKEVEEMVRKADVDNDGFLSRDEFVNMLSADV